jgi:hypothetical protein
MMGLFDTAMSIAGRYGAAKLGSTHLIADPDAVRSVLTDPDMSFGRCAGQLQLVDLADASCASALWDVHNPTYDAIVHDEVTMLLRSVCITSICGPRDDAFDANEAALDAAGHLMLRTVMAPAAFNVGSMHDRVERVISAALKHHVFGLAPRCFQPRSDLPAAIASMRDLVSSMACPAVVPASIPLDERMRAIIAMWAHGASALAASIAWLMCTWADDPASRRMSVDGLVERTLLEHPPIWWIARRALRRCNVRCVPIVDGAAVTYPYVALDEGDTAIMLPAAAQRVDGRPIAFSAGSTRCPAQGLTVLMLRELVTQLQAQRVDLVPASGARFTVHAGAVLRPKLPLLVPRHVQV